MNAFTARDYYRSGDRGASTTFSEDEWCRLFDDGIWVWADATRGNKLVVDPNWTGGANRNRWTNPIQEQDTPRERMGMHAFIRQQAEAGDELYEQLLALIITEKLTA